VTDLRELRRLEPLFWRAPSAHNTQPWLLEYSEHRVALDVDPARHLAAGDPTRRDLMLGLGAFVETVLVVAAAEGIGLELAGDAFVPGAVYETPFTAADVSRRQTSRLPYDGPLADADLEAVRAHLGPSERVHALAASELVEVFLVADRHVYESPPVVAELRRWLRLSKRDPDYTRDGLTYEALCLSAVEARVLGLLLRPGPMRVCRMLRLHRALAASSARVLREETVIILESDGDVREAGRALMRVWLELARRGLYTHPLSQILDCAQTESELARRLGIAGPRRLLSVFRAGRSAQPVRSARVH
jgi:nitroreductase